MSDSDPLLTRFPFLRIASAEVGNVSNTYIQRSESGMREVSGGLGNYFVITLEFGPLEFTAAKEFYGWVNSLQGRLYTFPLVIPHICDSKSTTDNLILVNGADQTSKQVNVDGLTPNEKGILRQGDFVQFGTSSKKVYTLAKDLNSDSLGEGVLYLNSLILGNSTNDNEQVIFRNVQFTVALKEDFQVWSINAFMRTNFSLQLEEVWN